MDRMPLRLSPGQQRWFDRVLVGVLCLPLAGLVGSGAPAAEVLLSAGLLVPLLWRRTRPVAAAAVAVAVSLLQVGVLDFMIYGQIGLPFTIYSVARYASGRWGLAALVTGLAGAVIAALDWRIGDEGPLTIAMNYVLPLAAIVTASWAVGSLIRTRRAYVDALVERGRRLEREAAQQAELAAADERARIAREMHDVVAHGLSVMVVQADGARYAAPRDPEAATTALATIAETGRASLTEMRRMLGLLRSDDGGGSRPQPGLADVRWLIEQARAAGTPVIDDLPDPLPEVAPGVGLTAYRIVQEALTNVRKHAGPRASATVRLEFAEEEIVLEIRDDGRGASAIDDGGGLGLLGMRERVGAHGGAIETGPASGGGFGVTARIPR